MGTLPRAYKSPKVLRKVLGPQDPRWFNSKEKIAKSYEIICFNLITLQKLYYNNTATDIKVYMMGSAMKGDR
jgi:hypothetical protein